MSQDPFVLYEKIFDKMILIFGHLWEKAAGCEVRIADETRRDLKFEIFPFCDFIGAHCNCLEHFLVKDEIYFPIAVCNSAHAAALQCGAYL